jgi:hypothetical protein
VERFFLNAGKYGYPDVFDWQDVFDSLAFTELSIKLVEVFEQ